MSKVGTFRGVWACEGVHLVTRFSNGYGLSVIRGPYSYSTADTYEVAMIHWTGSGVDDYEVGDTILADQSVDQVMEFARDVAALTPVLTVNAVSLGKWKDVTVVDTSQP